MRPPRIFVELPLDSQTLLVLPPGPSKHLTQVLRLRSNDPLILFNGDGRDFPGRLLIPTRGAAQVKIDLPSGHEPAASLTVHLGVGVSKGDRMDLVIQKAVELGVSSISPLFTKRSVVRLDAERLEKRRQHWRGVLIAACEQCGRRRLPRLAAAGSLAPWLALRHPFALMLDHRSDRPLTGLAAPAGEMTLLVGPEGGLSPDERTLAKESGFTPVRLGPRILRTETTPLAALATAQALWGDFRA